jgi:hypothetical protein
MAQGVLTLAAATHVVTRTQPLLEDRAGRLAAGR